MNRQKEPKMIPCLACNMYAETDCIDCDNTGLIEEGSEVHIQQLKIKRNRRKKYDARR